MKKTLLSTLGFEVLAVTLTLFDVTVDAGGVNRSNGYVVNATDNSTDTSGNPLTPLQRLFHSSIMLENAQDVNIHNQFGIQETIRHGHGPTVSFRGLDPYPAATTPLVEGVTPVGNTMSMREVTCRVYQYGAYTPFTDLLGLMAGDPISVMDSQELGAQAGRTADQLTREVLNAGTMVQYAPIIDADGNETPVLSRKAITADAKFTVSEILKAARFLKRNKATPFGDSFVALIHPDVEYDVLNSKGFKEITTYTQNVDRIYKGEIGKVGMVRFVVSPETKVFEGEGAGGIDVYSTIVLGQKAYGTISMEGGNLEHIVKPVGSAGAADPLNQRGTRGWKMMHGAVRLCESAMLRVESACTPVSVVEQSA